MPETSTAGIFQVAFIARQMEQTPRAFFQTTFEPIGRVCAARHARGGLGLQGKWRTRACVPHTPYMRATACLIPTAALSSLPWERVRERATSRKACIGEIAVFGKIAAIRRMPSPQPSPTGEGAGCSRFMRCRENRERVRAYLTHPTCGLRLAVFLAKPLIPTAIRPLSRGRELERGQQAARLVF